MGACCLIKQEAYSVKEISPDKIKELDHLTELAEPSETKIKPPTSRSNQKAYTTVPKEAFDAYSHKAMVTFKTNNFEEQKINIIRASKPSNELVLNSQHSISIKQQISEINIPNQEPGNTNNINFFLCTNLHSPTVERFNKRFHSEDKFDVSTSKSQDNAGLKSVLKKNLRFVESFHEDDDQEKSNKSVRFGFFDKKIIE